MNIFVDEFEVKKRYFENTVAATALENVEEKKKTARYNDQCKKVFNKRIATLCTFKIEKAKPTKILLFFVVRVTETLRRRVSNKLNIWWFFLTAKFVLA